MTSKEFLQTYGINDDTIYDNAERMHSLECLLEEYAQEQKKLFAIPVVRVSCDAKKIEEAALKAYPQIVCNGEEYWDKRYDINEKHREAFIKGVKFIIDN